jgi:hypothetical protein
VKQRKEGDAISNIIRLLLGCSLAASLVFTAQAGPTEEAVGGVLNATYLIEKQPVRLVDGRAEIQAARGSTAKTTTAVFGKPAYGDLNRDGRNDAALLLVHDPGGSGTFYYAAAAIAASNIYQGTNTIFLGDRISPRAVQIQNGVIIVEFDDRKPAQAMAAEPSIAKVIYLRVDEGSLTAIEPHGPMRVLLRLLLLAGVWSRELGW